MFVILVHKSTGRLEIVTKGSKKYRRIKKTCNEYKSSPVRQSLEKEVLETNKLLMS